MWQVITQGRLWTSTWNERDTCPEEDRLCQAPCLSHKVVGVRITLESKEVSNVKELLAGVKANSLF